MDFFIDDGHVSAELIQQRFEFAIACVLHAGSPLIRVFDHPFQLGVLRGQLAPKRTHLGELDLLVYFFEVGYLLGKLFDSFRLKKNSLRRILKLGLTECELVKVSSVPVCDLLVEAVHFFFHVVLHCFRCFVGVGESGVFVLQVAEAVGHLGLALAKTCLLIYLGHALVETGLETLRQISFLLLRFLALSLQNFDLTVGPTDHVQLGTLLVAHPLRSRQELRVLMLFLSLFLLPVPLASFELLNRLVSLLLHLLALLDGRLQFFLESLDHGVLSLDPLLQVVQQLRTLTHSACRLVLQLPVLGKFLRH